MSISGAKIFRVRKDIPIPMYYQIKQSILGAINDGDLKGGDMIPTELEFCEACDVSRPTVRQALGELVSEGYLYRCKGKGTFVSQPKIDAHFLNILQSFNQEMQEKDMVPSTKVLKFEVVQADEAINEKLEMNSTDKLIYLERLRYANDEPIVYLETFLPYDRFSKLIEEDLSKNSLYEILEECYQQRVVRVSRVIEAINANAAIADRLNISKGSAVCLVKTVGYTEEKLPVEYSVARYRGDRNKFSIELCR